MCLEAEFQRFSYYCMGLQEKLFIAFTLKKKNSTNYTGFEGLTDNR